MDGIGLSTEYPVNSRRRPSRDSSMTTYSYDNVLLLKMNRAQEAMACPPKASHIAETLRALQNRTFLKIRPPAWIGQTHHDLSNAITVKNGILLPGSRELLVPSPAWFTITTLDTSYAPDATCPLWEKFLLDLRLHDIQSRDTLQEIFGYLLTRDMSQEKIFALLGPPRSGKGTIMSTLRRLLGDDSTASMTLASLTEGFARQQGSARPWRSSQIPGWAVIPTLPSCSRFS